MPDAPGVLQGALTGGITGGVQPRDNSQPAKPNETASTTSHAGTVVK